jgi:hypothetical protein
MSKKGRKRVLFRPWNIALILGIAAAAAVLSPLEMDGASREAAFRMMLVAGVAGTALFIRELLMTLRVLRWPVVPGVVTRSETVRVEETDCIAYRPAVEIAFTVEGREYRSGTVRRGMENLSSSFESRWRGLVERYPVGTGVSVSCNPAKPGEAYAERLSLLPLVGFFALAAGFLGVALLTR